MFCTFCQPGQLPAKPAGRLQVLHALLQVGIVVHVNLAMLVCCQGDHTPQ